MSVNLNLSFEIHNISEIHLEEDETKRNEIYAAAEQFMKDEGLFDQDMIIDFLGQEGNLVAYTTYPVIISRSYVWVPDVTERWKAMAHRVLGEKCKPFLDVEYEDEEY